MSDECVDCGDCHAALILNNSGKCRACMGDQRIAELEATIGRMKEDFEYLRRKHSALLPTPIEDKT
jgi:hypothetical protein